MAGQRFARVKLLLQTTTFSISKIALLKASLNGHWHDAEVKVHGDQLVITHKDEDA